MSTPATALAVFSRAPVPGATKTRLIPLLGAPGAARAHAQLLDISLREAVAAFPGGVSVWAAGDVRHPGLLAAAERWDVPVQPQRGAGLGERMSHTLAELLARDPRALLIGSDCALLSSAVLRQASAALADHDMVFVPAEDGGYVLVGARAGAQLAPAFAGIAWSTSAVMDQTRAALHAAGVRFAELAPLWDIDEPADWQRALAAGLVSPVDDSRAGPQDTPSPERNSR